MQQIKFINATNDVIVHANESEEEIVPTCLNCRNQNTSMCRIFLKNKRFFLIKNGYACKKKYCKFWAYLPIGMWSECFWSYKPIGLIE